MLERRARSYSWAKGKSSLDSSVARRQADFGSSVHLLGHYVDGVGPLRGGIQAESENDWHQTEGDTSDTAMDDVQRSANQVNDLSPADQGSFRPSEVAMGDHMKKSTVAKGKDHGDGGSNKGTSSKKRKTSMREDDDQEVVEGAPVYRKRKTSTKPDDDNAEYRAPGSSRRKGSAGPDAHRLSTLRNRSVSRTPSMTMEAEGGQAAGNKALAQTPQDAPPKKTWSFTPWKR